jgi:hypothetical protein
MRILYTGWRFYSSKKRVFAAIECVIDSQHINTLKSIKFEQKRALRDNGFFRGTFCRSSSLLRTKVSFLSGKKAHPRRGALRYVETIIAFWCRGQVKKVQPNDQREKNYYPLSRTEMRCRGMGNMSLSDSSASSALV